jgi:hypothetical protein
VEVPAVLRGGPGDGQLLSAASRQLVWRACLYEATTERALRGEEERRVFAHREDCCESFGRGAEDRCE